jgi:tRNA G37 N-methylase Trm5
MGGTKLLGYSVRYVFRAIGRNWGARVLARLPKSLTAFETVVSYRGARLWVDTFELLGRSIFYFNEYEWAHESAFVDLVSNKTVFDIGANVGVFTMLAALTGATVFAFEPSSLIRPILERNLSLNGFAKEVTIVSDAVSSSDGMLPFL